MNVLEEMSASSTSDIWSNVILIKKTRELFSFSMWELLTLNVSGTAWWLSVICGLRWGFLLIISFSLVIKYSLLSLLCSAVQNCFYLISISPGRKWHTLIVFISNCSLICVKWQKLTIRLYIDISKTITLPDLPDWPQWDSIKPTVRRWKIFWKSDRAENQSRFETILLSSLSLCNSGLAWDPADR